jgi:elongation factor G
MVMKDLEGIRNIGVIAHIDAGKTTTTERMLYYTRKIHRIGEVDDGSATMDWMDQEKERGITITSAATTCYWKGKQINIVDTPGHIDFTGEVERSLRVLDGTVMVFSAVEGVESQSEGVWLQADKYQVPRIVYINKLDRMGADPYSCIEMIAEKLTGHPIELQFPVGIEKGFASVCDVISEKLVEWIPGEDGSEFTSRDIDDSLRPRLEEAKRRLLESISMEDDEIAEDYLADRDIDRDTLVKAIRRLTIEKRFVPIFFGSSVRNVGIQPLLDAIVDYLPSPLERISDTDKSACKVDSQFVALAFKIQSDPHGKLVYLRIYSGSIRVGEQFTNVNTGARERISQIFLMHANKRKILKEASAGDIVAVYGPKDVRTGHTLAAIGSDVKLETLEFPEPVIFAKIEPKTHQDEAKFHQVLESLTLDDPTIEVRTSPETGETLIAGMGELHLQVASRRMEREFAVHTRLGNPQVAYKETILKAVQTRGKFIKQTGGRGQYGDVVLDVRPTVRGSGFKFTQEVKNGAVPREYWKAVRKGAESSMQVGILAGFPVVDVEVVLIDGTYHSIDSSDIAFQAAASIAVKEALQKGISVLLEPEMKLEIVIPQEYLGNVLDDLSARGGKIVSLSGAGIRHNVMASCPLRKLFGYATTLRSLTQGRVVHLMKFDSYSKLSEEEQTLVLKKTRGY